MSLKNNIVDGTGTGFKAKVNTEHALLVSQVPNDVPVVGTPNRYRYHNEACSNTVGVTNQAVDGSITPVEFTIDSNLEYDIHIMKIVVIIADASVVHNSFGAGSPVVVLTNGWDLYAVEEGDVIPIVDKAKTSGEVIIQSGLYNPYGADASSFELTNYSASADATTVTFPIFDYIPQGIRIGRASENKLVSVVNDDLTHLEDFKVRVFGYRNYPTGFSE